MTENPENVARRLWCIATNVEAVKPHGWASQYMDFYQLAMEQFSTHKAEDKKDSRCFVPGHLLGNQRNTVNISRICFLVYDIDCTQTYDQVRDILIKLGHVAFLYTTYSHNTNKMFLSTTEYIKWAKAKPAYRKNPDEYTKESIQEYFQETGKSHLKVLEVAARSLPVVNVGLAIRVDHEPVHKMRVVFPLDKHFIVDDNKGFTTSLWAQQWKGYYVGVANSLGLEIDRSCSDPGRLYYFPAHPMNASEYKLEVLNHHTQLTTILRDDKTQDFFLNGETFLNYEDYPQSTAAEYSTHGHRLMGYAASGAGYNISGSFSKFGNLVIDDWFQRVDRKKAGLALYKLLEERAPEQLLAPRGGDKTGRHIVCPFEDEHSSVGGLGTFIDPGNADDPNDKAWLRIHCTHNHCQGRKTYEYVAKMLVNGWLSENDLIEIERATTSARVNVTLAILDEALAHSEEQEAVIKEAAAVMNAALVIDPEARNNFENEFQLLISHWADDKPFIDPKFTVRMQTFNSARAFTDEIEIILAQNPLTDAEILCLLSISNISVIGAVEVYTMLGSKWPLTRHDLEAAVIKSRSILRPLEKVIDSLLTDGGIADTVTKRLKDLAAWYGLTYAGVKMLYDGRFRMRGGSFEKAVALKSADLSSVYAKVHTGSDMMVVNVKSLENGEIPDYMSFDAFQRVEPTSHSAVDDLGKYRMEKIAKYWLLEDLTVPVYKGMHFIADKKAAKAHPQALNTFVGFPTVGVAPLTRLVTIPKAGPKSYEMMNEHIRTVWCNGDERLTHWVITWLADILQNPGDKPPTALIITGGQGTGKTFVFEQLQQILHPYVIIDGSGNTLKSNFNSALMNKLLFVSEEAHDSSHSFTNLIKSMTGNSETRVEEKGQNAKMVRSFMRLGFIANDAFPLKISPDDRRFLVLRTHDRYKQDKEYFTPLYEEFARPAVRAAWAQFLLDWNPQAVGLTWADLKQAPPLTEAKSQQISASLSGSEQLLVDLGMSGEPVCGSITERAQLEELNVPYWEMDSEWMLERKDLASICGLRPAIRKFIAAPDVATFLHTVTNVLGLPLLARSQRVAGKNRPQLITIFPTRRALLTALLAKGFITTTEHDTAISAYHAGTKVDHG